METLTKAISSEGLTASNIERYYPLCINFSGAPQNTRKWTLYFQSKPKPEIRFTGDEPTRDEIIQCLIGLNAPIWMIEVCGIAAAVAVRN